MALESRQINVSELDFDQIKANLKTYLRGQTEFADYDFEGSGLSVLLDVLAYNTHYNGLYNNMTINEAFIDSATKRSSIVSRANELGYVPHSASCSTAVINMTVSNTTTASPPNSIVLPKNTPFNTNISNVSYTFYTTEEVTALNNGFGVYTFNNLVIKQGVPLTFKQTVSIGARYVIPNANVDLSTLLVRVQDSATSTNFTTYTNSNSILNITPTDTVYFIKEIDDQLYELTFGDGVLGKQLNNGNVVHIEYFVSGLDAPNGARAFTYNGSSLSGGTVSLTTITPAYNGSAAEGIESIRFNAPKAYTAQNRAVTSDDYKTLIYNNFPEAKAVSVWGGETETPAQYGKVFISIVPQTIRTLTDGEKEYVLSTIIEPRKTLTITPEIVDPTYIKIQLDISYYYNPQLTTRSSGDITTLIEQTVSNYNDESLSSFGGIFRYSKLSRLIDATEPSISNNITTVKLHRDITPVFNVTALYNLSIKNPIYNSGVPEESIITTGFYCTDSSEVCYIDDLPVEGQSVGKLRLFYYGANNQKIIIKGVGTVNYNTGAISITGLQITSLFGQSWSIAMKPQSNDVVSVKNQFCQIDPTLLSITPIVDYPSKAYTFTSSRN